MIIPSIDLMDSQTVQLVEGKKENKEIEAGSPLPVAKKFSIVGDIVVIDLDSAMGSGSNEDLIMQLVEKYPCRVGGGIRDYETAVKWLDAGAKKIIIGSAATPKFLSKLPKERIIAAVDSKNSEVVVEGWQKNTGKDLFESIKELKDYVSGFLVTFVESEGKMQGFDFQKAKKVVEAAGTAKVTIAGGITTREDVAKLHEIGADAQVGMALYTGKLSLADAVYACSVSDREDGLLPTIVCDERGQALGLCWSNKQSINAAIEKQQGIYFSRKRGLWEKGKSSGNTQELIKIDLDCDSDTLRFTVRQKGMGFCHNNTWTCWGEEYGLHKLYKKIFERKTSAPENSYTKRLFNDAVLLNAKIIEEAGEFIEAIERGDKEHITQEAADLIYFTIVGLVKHNISISEVEHILDKRSLKISRRPGDAKNNRIR